MPRVAAVIPDSATPAQRDALNELKDAEAPRAGLSHDELAELVGHATATTPTRCMHHPSDGPVDFPAVEVVETLAGEEAAAA